MTRMLLAACGVFALLAGLQTWRVERVKSDLVIAQRDLKTANKLAADLADIGQADAQTQSEQCIDRVAQARRSAQRIESIIERPVYVDPQGCAVRRIVPADELRDALG